MVSWVDDNLLMGNWKGVEIEQKKMLTKLSIEEGEIKQYIGCIIELNQTKESIGQRSHQRWHYLPAGNAKKSNVLSHILFR